MRVIVGIERGAPELLAELDRLLPLRRNELVLAHVVDSGARGELERARGWLPRPRPLPPHRVRAIGEAERQAAAATLHEAAEAARALGADPEVVAAEGEPGRVLARLGEERRCSLVVVGARVDRQAESQGPHSVGHTARFVLDHSLSPVLLVRGHASW
ncbi:MAG TPA: universal stress protein [Candidatus Dormibacteraeota bacterium]